MRIYRPFKEWSPELKFAMLMVPASLTFLLHNFIFKNHLNLEGVMSSYYYSFLRNWEGFVKFTISGPIEEEVFYRGPAFITLIVLLWLTNRIPKENLKKWLERGSYAIAIGMLAYPTLIWAKAHNHYTITLFFQGLIFGGIMIYKKKFSYAVLFHSGANILAAIHIYLWVRFIH